LPDKIHAGAQGKHQPGHNNYNPAGNRSTFLLKVNPQELLDGVRSGQYIIDGYNNRGMPTANFGKIIGIYRDAKSGEGMLAERGIIHYGKNGVHIVPAPPVTPK